MIKTSPVYELHAEEFNIKLAEALKKFPEFIIHEWSHFVKTGVSRIKPPTGDDFWFRRAASILRQAYVRRIVGVNRLKTRYGGKQNRGMKPEIFRRASGKIIRNILQQAEAAGLLEKYNEPGKRAGRKLTTKGKELLESIEGDKPQISDNSQKQEIKTEEQEAIAKENLSEKPITDTKIENLGEENKPITITKEDKEETLKSNNSQNDSSEEQEKSEQVDIDKKDNIEEHTKTKEPSEVKE